MCVCFHRRCIYSEGLRPVVLLCAEGHSVCKTGELNWKDLRLQCGAVLLFYTNTYFHSGSDKLHSSLMNLLFSPQPLHFTFTFFFLSLLFLPLFFPWAFYYTAKATIMSPLCLKPNAHPCVREHSCVRTSELRL